MSHQYLALVMFATVCLVLMAGFPVAYSLAGTALLFAGIGSLFGVFDSSFLFFLPNRVFGIMTNDILIAVPLFVLMGVMLERSKISEQLLTNMARLFGRLRGGLGVSVALVGALLAASTGIVGATVVTMGLISLPAMLNNRYSPSLATGTICATGTLGQIIPPSIALVLLGDILSSAYQQAQLNLGIFNPETVGVRELFLGALFPGVLLVVLYIFYILGRAHLQPNSAPAAEASQVTLTALLGSLLPPLLLIFIVLGSILAGIATPTEAAGVGALGATVLALLQKQLSIAVLRDVVRSTTQITCMIFLIFIGAAVFSLVFRGFGGEELVNQLFESLPGGAFSAILVVMLLVFLLGFILDFIEITFVVVPLVAPTLLAMGVDPVWLGIMLAINLQTSFLTPPFGFALFYLRGVAPKSVPTSALYRGVAPFILIQLMVLIILSIWPQVITWLPDTLNR